jgi:diguanylate cyclase (GGDEF)-like protein
LFLVIVLVAIRFQGHGVALGLVMTAMQALAGAIQGKGYFAHDIAQTELISFWAYIMALSAVGMVVATYDAERKQAVQLRAQREDQFKLIFNTLSEGVSLNEIVLDDAGEMVDYKVLQVNDAFYTVADFDKSLPVVGQTATKLYGMDEATIKAFWTRNKNSVETLHDEMLSPITKKYYSISTSPFKNHRFVTSFHDITHLKQATAEIVRLAYHDPLTQLANRLLLTDRLEQALASNARIGRSGALLFIDLDDFKGLNDTLGHGIGDLLLQQVAIRLESVLREVDTVARLGGDEFVAMLLDLSAHPLEAAAQIQGIGKKVLAALSQPYQLDIHTYRCTASIGVALFSDNQQAKEEIMKQADIAMYQAKKSGRNALRFFDRQMQESVSARAALQHDLREAVHSQQFVLHYQPQVVGSGRITGVEALVRWQHPQRGMVSPAEFIPLAEETDLILSIGQWVLDTACAQLMAWAPHPDMALLSIAVNVSARQLQQPDFVASVLATLERTQAPPRLLKLELTESMLVDNVDAIIAKMGELKAKGVTFSLDDFGTGYSSLAYLKRLPLDQLKIDQGFVRNIVTDPNDAVIAKMVVVLAESMGLSVIAEGVELQAQADFLARQGCHAYQGYLFSRPLPLAAFEAFVRSRA